MAMEDVIERASPEPRSPPDLGQTGHETRIDASGPDLTNSIAIGLYARYIR